MLMNKLRLVLEKDAKMIDLRNQTMRRNIKRKADAAEEVREIGALEEKYSDLINKLDEILNDLNQQGDLGGTLNNQEAKTSGQQFKSSMELVLQDLNARFESIKQAVGE